ncbi:MAG: hypothetical protein ACOYMR_17225 [Ilumatobacteraceae bacterium]
MTTVRRRRLGVAVLGVLAVLTLPVAIPSADAVTPPAKRLFMVSDSVGLGAIPAIRSRFAGWQVTVTGKPGLFTEQLANYVNTAPASALGDSAIVATGYNYPYWDPPRFARSVDLMVARLKARGVKRIFWVTMREVTPAYYAKWNGLTEAYRTVYLAYPGANEQLRKATTRHPELSVIDWAANADLFGLSYDAIHLNPTGAARYANLAYTTVTTGITRSTADTVTTVPVAGRGTVPADAVAVSVNVTVVNPRSNGHVSVYPCGTAIPTVSTLNTRAATTTSNGAIVGVGSGGAICVHQSVAAHVIIDVNGAFSPTSGWVPLTPSRAVDTRPAAPAAGAVTTIPLAGKAGVPGTLPFTAVVNLTAIGTTAGSLRIFACGATPPKLPSMSYVAGQIRNANRVVRTDATGRVCVTTTGGAAVIVDLMGAFDQSADAHPFPSRRVLDTRAGTRVPANTTVRIPLTGAGATPAPPRTTGALLTVTVVSPAEGGYAVAFPCAAGAPRNALVNATANRGNANSGLVGVDASGAVCVRSTVAAHLVVDDSGWMGNGLTTFAPSRVLDTRTD